MRSSWWPALAAAVIVFAFGLGRVTTSPPVDTAPERSLALPSGFAEPIAFVSDSAAGAGSRVVRMIYTPDDSSFESVSVAGSFNGWNSSEVPMRNEGGVWTAVLVLPPGSYEYMFVEDGVRWVTDPLALRSRDDGFGGRNAVIDLGA